MRRTITPPSHRLGNGLWPTPVVSPNSSTLPGPPSAQDVGFVNQLVSALVKFLGLGSVISSVLPGLGGGSLSSQISSSIKLFMIGTMVESGRRFWQWVFTRFNPKLSITARFSEGDPIHEWIVLFLTDKKVWHRSRDYFVRYKTSTRRWGVTVDSQSQSEKSSIEETIEYLPSFDTPQLFRWNGYWIEVLRDSKTQNSPQMFAAPRPTASSLCLNLYTLNQNALKGLIEEAKEYYVETSKQRVIVRSMGGDGGGRMDIWNRLQSKTYRPLESIILPDGVLESIVTDARDFIVSEDWYLRAGIPYRRGYLFYGPPGTGKSSTVYALAGELGLEIYTLSLSSDAINDTTLRTAVERIPKRGILLIEDIDCAFPSREDEDEQNVNATLGLGRQQLKRSAVTMSGLLNILDGVDSEEGKIFMATTNYVDRLDAALMRPGRIDMKIQYKLASRRQATALFNRFFAAADPSEAPGQPYVRVGHHPLAESFAETIPEDEFTIAELQGLLLSCKTRPEAAVSGAPAWVQKEREERVARDERERERRDKLIAATTRRKAMAAEGFGGSMYGMGGFGASPMPVSLNNRRMVASGGFPGPPVSLSSEPPLEKPARIVAVDKSHASSGSKEEKPDRPEEPVTQNTKESATAAQQGKEVVTQPKVPDVP